MRNARIDQITGMHPDLRPIPRRLLKTNIKVETMKLALASSIVKMGFVACFATRMILAGSSKLESYEEESKENSTEREA